MNDKYRAGLRSFRTLSKCFHYREESRYLIIEFAVFAVITAASAVALLGAMVTSIT